MSFRSCPCLESILIETLISKPRITNQVENRYVEGLEGIKALPEIKVFDEEKKKTKNFGGSAVTSGDKTKGIKNAKRMG
jgi:hypothetical protein